MNEILIGRAVSRIDGPAKTAGTARYAAEFTLPDMVHAALVQAPFAAGRVDRLDSETARSMPGVIAVLRHDQPVHYFGQTIAVVVADSFERATAAAFAVRVHGDAAAPVVDMHQALAAAYTPDDMRGGADTSRGTLATGLADAHARIHATYDTPMEFHNPMEPHATLAAWESGRLTVWTATQGISSTQATLAAAFDLATAQVRVICPYVGGGFGCKGRCWPPVILAAHAARAVGRPVRLVLTREQMYMNNGHRPQTIQTLSLGCASDGRLTALRHDGFSQMSDASLGQFTEGFAIAARTLYSCPAVATGHKIVPTSFSLPTYMRAPGEASGMFALESAIDEMAAASGLDPLALRVTNYADHDENDNKPFASKALLQCYREGAARFGWSRRKAAPGTLRDGHVLIGMGMASATYPTNRQPAHARVTLFADGGVLVQSGTQDLGTGTYTIMMQVAAQILGAPPDKVRVALGDSTLPPSGVSGGSTTAASVMPAVLQAAQAVRTRAFGLALAVKGAAWRTVDAATMTLRDGIIASPQGTISLIEAMASSRRDRIEVDTATALNPDAAKFSRHAFGAQFVEVRIDEDFGTIRVSRYTGVFGVGRLLNATTGRSQLIGGIVYGLGMALLEAARPDPHSAQIMNANLSEYLVPVNADIPEIDVRTIDDPDMATGPLGLKGIGELPIVGVAGAVANAVFNATGKRVRSLPIRIEDVL